MKQHNGMRPHDVLILLKIIALGKGASFLLKDLSNQLSISPSEVSESINRSVIAGLIADDKKTPMRKVIYDFLVHGLPYVFPLYSPTGSGQTNNSLPLNALFSGGAECAVGIPGTIEPGC